MRDYYTRENMQGEPFHVRGAGLVFEPAGLSFEVEADSGREGVIRVRHRAGKPARGFVYPSDCLPIVVRGQFAPSADGTGMIRWRFDAGGLAPGRTVSGSLRVITPYGEYRIPFEVQILAKGQLLKKKAARGAAPSAEKPADREGFEGPSGGELFGKKEFLALAEKDFSRAAEIFYGNRLEENLVSGEDRTLYRGLSMQEGNLQNVEEFLISACGKERTVYEPVEESLFLLTELPGSGKPSGGARGRLAGNRAERALQAHRERVRSSGLGGIPVRERSGPKEEKKEEDVFLYLTIRKTGTAAIEPVIRAEGGFLPAAPFGVFGAVLPGVPGKDGEERMTVRIPVNRAALHAGRNFGRIFVHGPFNEAEVPVEVRCRSTESALRRRSERELELLQLQLMRMYVDFCLSRSVRTAGPGEDWFERADRLIDEIALRSRRDLMPRLFGVHLLLLRGQDAEAEREMGRIAVRYGGAQAMKSFGTPFTGEQEDAYCYRQYLYARCRKDRPQNAESAGFMARVIRFLHGVYRQTGDWRIAWMLMDLSEEYAPGTPARWNFLRRQFEGGCHSPVILLEAWEMVRSDPQILLPGSGVQERWARDDFGLQVLWYAARNNVLTPKAAQVMAMLAEKKKAFSAPLFKGLCTAFELWEEKDGTGSAPGEEARTGQAPEAGQEESVGERSLSEQIPSSRQTREQVRKGEESVGERSLSEQIPSSRQIREQVRKGEESDDSGRDGVKKLLLRAICILLLRRQDLSAMAHGWYSRALGEGISLTGLEEGLRRSAAATDPSLRMPEGFTAVLRTEEPRVCRAVLVYDRFRREQVFSVRGGTALLPVFGSACTVFLEDEAGNRYAKSLPFSLEIVSDPGKERKGSSLHDLPALAERIGFGSRSSSGPASFGKETAEGALQLLKSGELTGDAHAKLLLRCLSLIRAQGEEDGLSAAGTKEELLRLFLLRAEPARCSAKDRANLLFYLGEAGEYTEALRWLLSFGDDQVGADLLAGIFLGVFNDLSVSGGAGYSGRTAYGLRLSKIRGLQEAGQGLQAAALDLGWRAFLRGSARKGLLETLSASFEGLGEELLRLRKGCVRAGIPTGELDCRIVRQCLYTGEVLQAHAGVIAAAEEGLGEDFLPAVAQFADHAFATGVSMGEKMTGLVIGLLSDARKERESAREYMDICRIACLKELSMRQGELSEQEKAAARSSLTALLSKGIIFPFFRHFPGMDDRLDLYAEETLVQYHPSVPQEGKERHVIFHYANSRHGETGSFRSRPMKEMYRDFYVSGFLLFYGEQMSYFITDDSREKNVVQSGIIGQDARIPEHSSGRFGLINETTRAAALRDYDRSLSLLTDYYRRSYLEEELFRR